MENDLVALIGQRIRYFGEDWTVGMIRTFGDAKLVERYYFLTDAHRGVAMIPEDALVLGMSSPKIEE